MNPPAPADGLEPTDAGTTLAHGGLVERPSRVSFDLTVERLSRSIVDAGMQIFAVIDHAANARMAGLDMPPSTVIVYGKATGGTPIMLETPRSALDLPLRVLVRADRDGKTVVAFHPIASLLEAAGVSVSLAAQIEPAQSLLLEAIE
jgi:uncharacterized protein (DUF302 family)